MQKGEIDPKAYRRNDVLVIDADLMATAKFSWKKFKFLITYNPVISGITNFLAKKSREFDNVIIAGVGYGCKSVFKNLEEKLFLNTSMQEFDSEENYREWLLIIRPSMHFAVEKRRNYCPTSALIDVKAIGNYLS